MNIVTMVTHGSSIIRKSNKLNSRLLCLVEGSCVCASLDAFVSFCQVCCRSEILTQNNVQCPMIVHLRFIISSKPNLHLFYDSYALSNIPTLCIY